MTTKFKLIPCPNCSGRGYGHGDGGFTQPSMYAQVEPNCLICQSNGKLVICYYCNKIGSYHAINIMDRNSDKVCNNCQQHLEQPPPPKCNVHQNLVQNENGCVQCCDCQTVFTEADTQKKSRKSKTPSE